MRLQNTFNIPVPAADAWRILLDLERIAPCVPGAEITSRDGDEFNGKMKVKLGPISLTYKGIIQIVSRDESSHVAILEGGAREARGNGTAKALITCRLTESGITTDVLVETELDITGKPAQFGRGTLNEVAEMLIGQFADNLADELSSTTPEPIGDAAGPDSAEPGTPTASPGQHQTDDAPAYQPEPSRVSKPVDLLETTGIGAGVTLVLSATALVVLSFAAGVAFAHQSGR